MRELAARRILKAQMSPSSTTPRRFKLPPVNMDAPSYMDLIDWQTEISEPQIMKHLLDQKITDFVEAGGEDELSFLRLPCHTQVVERAVKVTTEASTSLCTEKARVGSIKAKLESRKILPKFETKRDFMTD